MEKIRAVKEVNTVIEGVRYLSLDPPVSPPPMGTKGKLLARIKEKLDARRAITRGSVLDMESAIW